MVAPGLIQARLLKVVGGPPRDIWLVGVDVVFLPESRVIGGAETFPPEPDEIATAAPEASGILIEQFHQPAGR